MDRPPSGDKPPLRYAPPPPWHRRRLPHRIAVGVALLVALALLWRAAPGLWWRAQLTYWQSRCLRYTAPQDQVVASPKMQPIVPREWSQFYALLSPPGGASAGTLFLHERTSADGQRRLVAVDLINRGLPGVYAVVARAFELGSLRKPPREILSGSEPTVSFGAPTDFYAGQIDPNDPSHFTVRLAVEGAEPVLDGWLMNNGQVRLEVRANSATGSSIPTGGADGHQRVEASDAHLKSAGTATSAPAP